MLIYRIRDKTRLTRESCVMFPPLPEYCSLSCLVIYWAKDIFFYQQWYLPSTWEGEAQMLFIFSSLCFCSFLKLWPFVVSISFYWSNHLWLLEFQYISLWFSSISVILATTLIFSVFRFDFHFKIPLAHLVLFILFTCSHCDMDLFPSFLAVIIFSPLLSSTF